LAGPASRSGRLAEVRSWGYQLQGVNFDWLAASPHDLLVIDLWHGDGPDGAYSADDIRRLRERKGARDRIVLAYMSIGEAETFRDYWRWQWGGRWYSRPLGWLFAPSWIGPENREWRGNFAVRYWDPAWQRLIVGPGGYLERIVAAGFDGVYLDKVDASTESIAQGRPSARDDMRDLVRRIAGKGRTARPGFLVVVQNGEELLTDPAYVALIDGVGKEDLLYSRTSPRTGNPEEEVAERIAMLAPATGAGRTVLAVEYLDDPARIATARRRLEGLGFVPYFADRLLSTLRHGDLPATAQPR
jgi:cysteinyl-tRNA synthetase